MSMANATYLDTDGSQRVFRALLATSAQPGTIGRLPDAALSQRWPPALSLPLCLGDLETSVAVCGPRGDEWTRGISAATGAATVAIGEADQVVFLRSPTPTDIDVLRIGTAEAPEDGAKVAVAVRRLYDHCSVGAPALRAQLSGPGIPKARFLGVSGLAPSAVARLQRRNAAYPAGIDVWLIADDGSVAALTRTTRVAGLTSQPSIQGRIP